MIANERDVRHEHILSVARQMMTAARTAPKGKGIDAIEVAMATDEDLQKLSAEMRQISEETGMKFFLRDADNILQAECVVIIGTREQPQGLNCGHCGYATCAARPKGVPCALNTVDVGIAIGSACATAADMRVDTRLCSLQAWLPNACNGCPNAIAYSPSLSALPPKIHFSTANLKMPINKDGNNRNHTSCRMDTPKWRTADLATCSYRLGLHAR